MSSEIETDTTVIPNAIVPLECLYTIKRNYYIVQVYVNGYEIDVNISLTPRGVKYARSRGAGHHRLPRTEDEGLTEIINAADDWREHFSRPDVMREVRHGFTSK
jgi:hypothetical protein